MAAIFFFALLLAGPVTFMVLGGAFLGATVKAVRYTDPADQQPVPEYGWQ